MTQPIREHALLLICSLLASLASQSLANDPPPQPIGSLDDYRAYRAELDRTQPADLSPRVRQMLRDPRTLCDARVAIAMGKWDEARAHLAKLATPGERCEAAAEIIGELAGQQDAKRVVQQIDALVRPEDRAAVTRIVAEPYSMSSDSAALRTLLEPLDPTDTDRFAVMVMLFESLAREGQLDAARALGTAESLRDVDQRVQQIDHDMQSIRDPEAFARAASDVDRPPAGMPAWAHELLRLRRLKDSEALLKLVSKTDPTHPMVQSARAIAADIAFDAGRKDEAIAIMSQITPEAIERLSDGDVTQFALAWIALGDRERAWKVLSIANGGATPERLRTAASPSGQLAMVPLLIAEGRDADAGKIAARVSDVDRHILMHLLVRQKEHALIWDNITGEADEQWIIRDGLIEHFLSFRRDTRPFE